MDSPIRKVVCIYCATNTQYTAYAKFKYCDHYICWDCYFKEDEAVRDVSVACMCLVCTMKDIMDNEPIHETECPTCYMSYEGNSRAQHNCLDDEGIYDMQIH